MSKDNVEERHEFFDKSKASILSDYEAAPPIVFPWRGDDGFVLTTLKLSCNVCGRLVEDLRGHIWEEHVELAERGDVEAIMISTAGICYHCHNIVVTNAVLFPSLHALLVHEEGDTWALRTVEPNAEGKAEVKPGEVSSDLPETFASIIASQSSRNIM